MNANAPSVIDLLLFHTMERNLFTRLTGRMRRDPERTKLVLALWLWFESIGHHDFIRHVYSFVDDVVLKFYKEAEAGLGCLLHFRSVSDDDDDKEIPLTASLVKEPMDLRFFEYHRDVAVSGIMQILNKVCRVIFEDSVMQMAARDTNQSASQQLISSGFITTPSGEGSSGQGAAIGRAAGAIGEAVVATAVITPSTVTVPVPPHGMDTILPAPVVPGNAGGAMWVVKSTLNPMARPWAPGPALSSEDQRSMFITFSKGHPIDREDVAEFFNSRYGHCVEVVMIEKVSPGAPPMYGRVVFTSAMMIALVLNGQRTAKFMIKGKHLWARMYVPRNQN